MTMKRLVLKEHVNEGEVRPDHFAVDTAPKPSTATDGEVLLEVLYLSVDPYMRGMMRNTKGYFSAPFTPGEPPASLGICCVVASGVAEYAAGDYVAAYAPWQEFVVVSGDAVKGLTKINPDQLSAGGGRQLPLSAFLGPLGMVGLTAYAGIREIGCPKAGETAFVSGAAGAVGYIAGQLFKHVHGCRVVGSAGSDEKVAFLKKCGYDEAWNYKTMSTKDALARFAPGGIDVYFDNVGGETLEATIDTMNLHGRIIACGAISQYDTAPGQHYGVKNLFNIVTKRLKMQGFIASDWSQEVREAFRRDMPKYLAEGKVTVEEHVVPGGIEKVGEAFCSMMKGANIGKMVAQVGQDPLRQQA